MSYIANAGALVVSFILGALIGLFVLRLLAEACRADFHNPVSQVLYRYTNPVLAPLRRALPNWRRINLAAALIAWALEIVKLLLLFTLTGVTPAIGGLLLMALAELLDFIAVLYLILIFGWALMSMLGTDPMHPVIRIVSAIVEPAMRPLRTRLPTLGGLDFSPMVAMLLLLLIRILLIQPMIDLAARMVMGG